MPPVARTTLGASRTEEPSALPLVAEGAGDLALVVLQHSV